MLSLVFPKQITDEIFKLEGWVIIQMANEFPDQNKIVLIFS